MRKVVIAEKPSAAADIASALGAVKAEENGVSCYKAKRKDGEYIVTNASGHVLSLDDEASGWPKQWDMQNLPFFPSRFVNKVSNKQYYTIAKLLKNADEVINAGDAGREGELIIREILEHAKYKGQVKRLWTSEALTREVVEREITKGLKPSSQYNSMYYAALARQHADQITGFNMTRAITIKAGGRGQVWSAGRVQTPVLRLIADRDLQRKNFKPEEYFVVHAVFGKGDKIYEGRLILPNAAETEDGGGSRITQRTTAEEIISKLSQQSKGVVVEVKEERKQELPPLLHSLTTLQMEANEEFGFTADKTLAIAQSLYEKWKVTTYPRTDAQCLGNDAVDMAKSILMRIGQASMVSNVLRYGKRVFNSAGLTDHHAIIPSKPKPAGLSEDESRIYDLIYRRFVGAFMPTYDYTVVKVLTKVGDYLFETTDKINDSQGWRSLYKSDNDEAKQRSGIPVLVKGETVAKKAEGMESKMTTPPPAYTEKSILAVMKKLGLGTPATRASILTGLKTRMYIKSSGRQLSATDKGLELIRILRDNPLSDPNTTAKWEASLENIWTKNIGEQGYKDFMGGIKKFVAQSVDAVRSSDIKSVNMATPKMLAAAKSIAKARKVKLTDTSFEGVKAFLDKYKTSPSSSSNWKSSWRGSRELSSKSQKESTTSEPRYRSGSGNFYNRGR